MEISLSESACKVAEACQSVSCGSVPFSLAMAASHFRVCILRSVYFRDGFVIKYCFNLLKAEEHFKCTQLTRLSNLVTGKVNVGACLKGLGPLMDPSNNEGDADRQLVTLVVAPTLS